MLHTRFPATSAEDYDREAAALRDAAARMPSASQPVLLLGAIDAERRAAFRRADLARVASLDAARRREDRQNGIIMVLALLLLVLGLMVAPDYPVPADDAVADDRPAVAAFSRR